MMPEKKLYVVCDQGLSFPQRAVQSGHALAEWLLRGPGTDWDNGTLVFLESRVLANTILELENLGIPFVKFQEPDMGNLTTAIATDHCLAKRVFKDLNLLCYGNRH